ncbi:MAG: ATP-binding protein [Anaerolineales bacterium]|jgi:serine/threonine-protein kinase RsbW
MSTQTFPSDVQYLDQVREFVGGIARAAGFSEKGIYAVQLAADEAASNIIEHAYGGRTDRKFRLHCEVQGDHIVLTFFDRGESFDFTNVEEPDITANLSERKIGGLGIFLMHKLMDEVEYKVAKSGNFLTLIKRKS